MWSLRRASIHLKNRGLSSETVSICSAKSEIPSYYFENNVAGHVEAQEKHLGGIISSTRFYNRFSSSSNSSSGVRKFSSQVGAKSDGDEDDESEDGFSELEIPDDAILKSTSADENDGELISESELSQEEGDADDMQNELETLDIGADVGEERSYMIRAIPAMTKALLAAPTASLSKVLDEWVEKGNEVTQVDASLTMLFLRKRRLYPKALKLSEWLEATKHIEFLESNYAARVDLIAKVRGIFKAQDYIQQIPESCRGELVYGSLLANCVSANNMKKSEEVFNKMKSLEFPITGFTCNQLLLLYKRTDKKKIADVLDLMEKENIKPSLFTYQILIDVKGQSNDITGMEQVVETMKDEGFEPYTQIQASLARHYANGGLKDKAEAILKEMEGDNLEKTSWVCRLLLPIYASLGRADEVERIWKVCEAKAPLAERYAAIEAWGKLNRIEDAEATFDKMMKSVKRPSSNHFSFLLKVYVNHKMMGKGKDLVKRMGESGCHIGPVTWDSLVKLFVGAGELEKADYLLEKASKQKKGRPLFSSFLTLLDQYAKKGDIHNAEKIFLKMKLAGYVSRPRQYYSLLEAYVNANAPAYGFSDRMKGDNIYIGQAFANQLARVDAFRKTSVSELLD